jgi:lipopolysaccharide/colanic/teichoic acid biosynthesis glycosyltransferase
MLAGKFENLPERMRCREVREYYDMLSKKRAGLFLKRLFDIVMSLLLIIILSPLLLGLSIAVAVSSKGPVFYRQERVTKNLRTFRIFKFRSMVADADRIGPLVTVENDPRITGVGRFMRKLRLDELPQLFNVLAGDMSFVGTRPEVVKYTDRYTNEILATLLLPAGVTSMASIMYKDEAELLEKADDADEVYVNKILPEKMRYNLEYLRTFSPGRDIKIMARTLGAIARR